MASFYTQLASALGVFGLVWGESRAGVRVLRVVLPRDGVLIEDRIRSLHANARAGSCSQMEEIGGQIASFLEGNDLAFPLDILALEGCSPFQQRVLRVEHGIPRGWVSTYGRIAAQTGAPGAARAVGSALARNPFPILIPCHRAVRSSLDLGGYQGGIEMKRALLELEGLAISPRGKVLTDRIHY
jgi:methylated-DNA-[protein]-cysteine S-methyltransferase